MMFQSVERSFESPSAGHDILGLLLERLFRSGILLAQIPRFLKDVLSIIGRGAASTPEELNERLARLGWQEQILDSYSYELLIYLLENDEKSLVQRDWLAHDKRSLKHS